jgi:hypothetical protein
MERRAVGPNALGRPSLIHDGRRVRRLLREIQRGTPKYVAATRVGIGESTLRRWLATGASAERLDEEGLVLEPWEEHFRAFRALVLRAIADFEGRYANLALKIAVEERKPTVILEILRRHPDTRPRWNVPTTIELAGDDDAAESGPASMSEAELVAQIRRYDAIAADREEEGATE